MRACLRENPDVYSSLFVFGERALIEATHLERFALMRNPEMGRPNRLIEQVFDLDDQKFSFTLEQRMELVKA